MIHLIGHLLEGGYRAWSFLRLLDYLSVRAIGAALFAFILVLAVMPRFMWYLHRRGLVDQMRETGVPSSFDKAGTPAMGGAVMVGAILAACLVWCDLASGYVWAVVAGTLWFAGIGLSDDVAKWRSRSGNRGMSEAGNSCCKAPSRRSSRHVWRAPGLRCPRARRARSTCRS